MTNPFYNRDFDVLEGSSNRSDAVEAEFQAIGQGFSLVAAYTAALDALKGAAASISAAVVRYADGLTANLAANGRRILGLGDPLDAGDAVNKGYVDGLVITAAAPQWIPTEAAENKTIAPFESCTVKAPGVEIQLPAAPTYGVTKVRIRVAEGMSARVMRNGLPIQAVNQDMDMTSGQWCELQAESETEGWVIA